MAPSRAALLLLTAARNAKVSPLHRAADVHAPKLSIALRYAFAVGRKALGAGTDADRAAAAVRKALEGVLPKALLGALRAGGEAGVEVLKGQLRAAGDVEGHAFHGNQWTDGGSDLPHVQNLDTSSVEGNSGYSFFNSEADKWTRASDAEARQNAFDMAQRDTPSLGQQLREAYFGKTDADLPATVSVYRVGGLRDGVNSFFPRQSQAEAYQKRFGVDTIQRVTFDPRSLVPTGAGSGEIFGHSNDVIEHRHLRSASGNLRAAKGPAVVAPFEMQFDASDPVAAGWAREHAADLAKDISDVSRDRIRAAVALQQETGEFARDEILAAVGDEARADLIARHESLLAANEGQRQAWGQAVDEGLLAEDAARTWITTPDAKLCPICEGLDGEETALGQPYAYDGDEFDGPPAHVGCRCTEGIA